MASTNMQPQPHTATARGSGQMGSFEDLEHLQQQLAQVFSGFPADARDGDPILSLPRSPTWKRQTTPTSSRWNWPA